MIHWLKPILRRALPKTLRPRRILAGPLRGARLVTSWHDYPAAILGYTEQPLLRWFSRNVMPGETWFDIGAHYGYTAIALCRRVGPQGRVFAFEPMLSTAGCVSQGRWLNRFRQLTVVPLALGAPKDLGLVRLPIVRGMADKTLVRREEGEAEGVGSKLWDEAIMTARLDWLWPKICAGKEKIDGIKIDVQGMEIEVLRGMLETLRNQRPKLIVEVHRDVDRSELLELIENVGYSRRAIPIEPIPGEGDPQYVDDKSYYFPGG